MRTRVRHSLKLLRAGGLGLLLLGLAIQPVLLAVGALHALEHAMLEARVDRDDARRDDRDHRAHPHDDGDNDHDHAQDLHGHGHGLHDPSHASGSHSLMHYQLPGLVADVLAIPALYPPRACDDAGFPIADIRLPVAQTTVPFRPPIA